MSEQQKNRYNSFAKLLLAERRCVYHDMSDLIIYWECQQTHSQQLQIERILKHEPGDVSGCNNKCHEKPETNNKWIVHMRKTWHIFQCLWIFLFYRTYCCCLVWNCYPFLLLLLLLLSLWNFAVWIISDWTNNKTFESKAILVCAKGLQKINLDELTVLSADLNWLVPLTIHL